MRVLAQVLGEDDLITLDPIEQRIQWVFRIPLYYSLIELFFQVASNTRSILHRNLSSMRSHRERKSIQINQVMKMVRRSLLSSRSTNNIYTTEEATNEDLEEDVQLLLKDIDLAAELVSQMTSSAEKKLLSTILLKVRGFIAKVLHFFILL